MTQGLADMRRDYTRDGLTEAQAPAEPFALFHTCLLYTSDAADE